MEPVVLVGNLSYRGFQAVNGTEVERGRREVGKQVVRVWTGVFAVEGLTSEDDLQCELVRFVEGACTCSCMLYELAHGGN